MKDILHLSRQPLHQTCKSPEPEESPSLPLHLVFQTGFWIKKGRFSVQKEQETFQKVSFTLKKVRFTFVKVKLTFFKRCRSLEKTWIYVYLQINTFKNVRTIKKGEGQIFTHNALIIRLLKHKMKRWAIFSEITPWEQAISEKDGD